MNWQELVSERGRGSRTWRDEDSPRSHVLEAQAGTRWHYPSIVDSAVLDAMVDMSPEHRVNTDTGLDVWRIEQNGWQYALGQPADKVTDGWVGFGGRRGAHWFKFRLARFAYYDRISKELTPVGGEPDYNRDNLTPESHSVTVGPNNDEIIVQTDFTWSDLWPNLPQGQIDAVWKADGNRLKEEISVDPDAQTVLRNQYPGGPASEHFLSTVFQIDWSDVPRRIINNVLTDVDDDTETDGEVELQDALGRLLAFMPIDYLYVLNPATGEVLAKEPLRRRFWKDPDSNHYLLTGIRCDVLNGLPEGTWVFDPTVDEQVGASSDDADRYGSTLDLTVNRIWLDYNSSGQNDGCRFTTVAVPSGATINSDTYLSLKVAQAQASPTGGATVYGEDDANPATFSTLANYDARSTTSANVSWNPSAWAVNTWEDSPDMSSIVQELVDLGSWASGNAMVFFFTADQTQDLRAYSYDGGSANAPKMHIDFSTSSTVDFSATLTAVSSTPDDVVLAIDRAMEAILTAQSSTPDDVVLNISRAMVAVLTAQSSTPDDAVLTVLGSVIEFAATLTATSVTPDDAVLTVLGSAIEFAATILAQSETPDDVVLAVNRAMNAELAAQSETPDDVVLTVLGAGGVTDEVLFKAMCIGLFKRMR